jgi:hypothetical protein
MRTTALGLLLLVTACGRGDPAPNQLVEQPGPQRPTSAPAGGPVVAIAATGPDGCAASWDGQAVTPAQITERSVALLEQAIAAAGGPQMITAAETLPSATVEAPADLGFACADTILFALQRSGMAEVRLKPAGSGAAVPVDFPLNTDLPPPPIPMVLGLGAGGRLTWNNDPLDEAGLANELRRIGGGTESPDPVEGPPPPGGLELRVTREATFGQLHALLLTVRRYQVRPTLYLLSAEVGPGSPAPPPSPPR